MQFALFGCNIEPPINTELKEELELIYESDQELRELCFHEINEERKKELSEKYGVDTNNFLIDSSRKLKYMDSLNLAKVEAIIKDYGYPGKSLVGEPANEAAWFVIQHNFDKIESYFPILEKAGMAGEISMKQVAMSEDRMLMIKGQEQIYGTQGYPNSVTVDSSNAVEYVMVIWPIKDPLNVNERRKLIGFTTTVEESAELLGVKYEILTMGDIDK